MIKIEVVRLLGDDALKFQCSMKQIMYIKHLMTQRGMLSEFQKHFMVGNLVIQNHLTMSGATLLIKSLLSNKEIKFIPHIPQNVLSHSDRRKRKSCASKYEHI